MSDNLYSGQDIIKLFSKLENKIEKLSCFIKECCSKIPINIGSGFGLYRNLSNNKWQFKSLVAGNNITITSQPDELIISSSGGTSDCNSVNNCLGISEQGSGDLFLNQLGNWENVDSVQYINSVANSNNIRLSVIDSQLLAEFISNNISQFVNDSHYTANNGTVTNVNAINLSTSGTDLSSSVVNSTTTPLITLNVPTASSTNRGVLSSTDWTTFNNKQNAITLGTSLQYIKGDLTLGTFPSIPTINPSALTKTDDTNVTLTLTGNSNTALLEPVNLSLGWSGTLADSRISSSSIWNAKQEALVSGTNIKTINTNSLLGSGNINIFGQVSTDSNNSSILGSDNKIYTPKGTTIVFDNSNNVSLTGTTSETIILACLIPGNTYTVGNNIQFESLFTKIGTAGYTIIRCRIYTSDNPSPLSSASVISTLVTASAGVVFIPFFRYCIHIDSASSTISTSAYSSMHNDIINSGASATTSNNIDWSTNQYLIITVQNQSALDTTTFHGIKIFK